MSKKLAIVFLLEIIGCASLIVIAIWQFTTIASKSATLHSVRDNLYNLELEIQTAEAILDTVSSEDYQALSARKNGYGVEGEKQYFIK